MTLDARPVRPIGTLKIGTPLLVAIILAIATPVGATWVVSAGLAAPDHEYPFPVSLAGPVTSVVIDGSNGSVHVTADQSLSGVSGKAIVSWHDKVKPQPVASVKDGVATLTFVHPPGTDRGNSDVSWEVSVPPTAAVTVTTSNGGVTLTGIGGAVSAATTNASIHALALGSGGASLVTSNGDIDAAFAGAPSSIKATTSNASVTITTDGKTPYFDRTKTSNGNTDSGNLGANDYTLAPTRMIDVLTSNGNITIR